MYMKIEWEYWMWTLNLEYDNGMLANKMCYKCVNIFVVWLNRQQTSSNNIHARGAPDK